MRLLNVDTCALERFEAGRVPPYAILSHTWLRPADREVTFQDLSGTSDWHQKEGCSKIAFSRRRAKADRLKYVWIDTCCIDKSDRIEIERAINSMYRWYQNAEVCYALLLDVPHDCQELSLHRSTAQNANADACVAAFCNSKWFTRGWTLQELLAPREVRFYGSGWNYLGDLVSLSPMISHATGIDELAYSGRQNRSRVPLEEFSVAQRLAWVAERRTTEPEDLAYCLVGLFDISMSPQYGEGLERAFKRLQLEILKDSTDHSIFAWTGEHPRLLAPSPECYSGCSNLVTLPAACSNHYQDLTNWSVKTGTDQIVPVDSLRLRSRDVGSATHVMCLHCRYRGDISHVPGLMLQAATDRRFAGSEEVFAVAGGCQRVQRIPIAALPPSASTYVRILTKTRPALEEPALVLDTFDESCRPLHVVAMYPPENWFFCLPVWNSRSWVHVGKGVQNDNEIAGARLSDEHQRGIDVIFEFNRAAKQLRLLLLSNNVREDLADRCRRAQTLQQGNPRQWIGYNDGLNASWMRGNETLATPLSSTHHVIANDCSGMILVAIRSVEQRIDPTEAEWYNLFNQADA